MGVTSAEPSGAGSEVIKVACVGDSITRGTFVWRRRSQSYPAQLQVMLGDRFHVRNFGVNGHAVQQSTDRPHRKSEAFALSSAFEPDVVLVMLGTNDSRGNNWRGLSEFEADYRSLIVHYQSLESSPQVWLLTPPALFRVGGSPRVRYGMNELAIQEMSTVIKAIGRDLGCEIIDINATTATHPEAFKFDGVHPGAAGARLIAGAVHRILAGFALA